MCCQSRGSAPRERMATRVSVLGRRAMVSALRRPPLKSSRAEAGPTWGISVSATISCFTPASARDCKQHLKNFKSATPNKQWGPVVLRAASSYLLSACIDWDVSNTQPGEIGFCAQSALWPSRSSIITCRSLRDEMFSDSAGPCSCQRIMSWAWTSTSQIDDVL